MSPFKNKSWILIVKYFYFIVFWDYLKNVKIPKACSQNSQIGYSINVS